MSGLLSSPLVQTALLGAGLIGALAGALGVFAVQRRESLLGDVISHAALPGICLGYLVAGGRDLGALLLGAFGTGALAALTLHQITTRTRLKPDAALGIVLSLFFAAGIVLLTYVQSLSGGAALALQAFLFGQAAAITPRDVGLLVVLAGGIALILILFWKPFKFISFDPQGAVLAGYPVRLFQSVLTLMIAAAVVMGLQLAGVVLMVALLVAPAVAARAYARSFGITVILGAIIGALSGMGGALISATARGLSTGPVVVLLAVGIVILSLILAPERGLLPAGLRRHKARHALDDGQVLGALRALAKAHDNRAYPVEGGMLDAALGPVPQAQLQLLEARGLIRSVTHPPETTPHWELTEAGHDAARKSRDANG